MLVQGLQYLYILKHLGREHKLQSKNWSPRMHDTKGLVPPRSDPSCLELRAQARAHTAVERLVTGLGELEQVQQKVEQVQQRADQLQQESEDNQKYTARLAKERFGQDQIAF